MLKLEFRQKIVAARPYHVNSVQAAQLHHYSFKLESVPVTRVPQPVQPLFN